MDNELKVMARAMQIENRPKSQMLNSDQQEAKEYATLPAYIELAKAARQALDEVRATRPADQVTPTEADTKPYRDPVAKDATHICVLCAARWKKHDDESWSLVSEDCGPCCDNAVMGIQIIPLNPDGSCGYDEHKDARRKIEKIGRIDFICSVRPKPSGTPTELVEAVSVVQSFIDLQLESGNSDKHQLLCNVRDKIAAIKEKTDD